MSALGISSLSSLHFSNLAQTIYTPHLPAIFAVIAFWTGAGGWIVVMTGALNNISDEVIDSAKIDGANALQLALRIKLPLIKKWVVYMVDPGLRGRDAAVRRANACQHRQRRHGQPMWSPNQLAYYFGLHRGQLQLCRRHLG